MVEAVDDRQAAPRAFLRVGGMSVARHQLGLLLALGCERVVCICAGLAPEMLAMQHTAEAAKAQFHVIASLLPLAGLVTATDELFVLAEGLLAMPGDVAGLLEQGQAVLILPAEIGIPAGFERIDLNHAAAGAMRLPGRLVDRIADLPLDCDAASSLMRIALQSGTAQRLVPNAARDSLRWTLVRSEAEAHAVETPWIQLHTISADAITPGGWLARQAVRAFGPTLLHAGSNANYVIMAAGAMILLAVGAGWFGYATMALMLAAAGWLLRRTGGLLSRVEHDSLQNAPTRWPREAGFGWLYDGLIVTVLAWGISAYPGQMLHERAFPPMMLLALLRILPRAVEGVWTMWLHDRMLLTLMLAAASFGGVLWQAVLLMAVALALTGIVLPRQPREG